METKIFQDKAGNKIFKKFIKTRNIWQFYAKNRQGLIINPRGVNKLVKESGLNIGKSTKIGIQKIKIYR